MSNQDTSPTYILPAEFIGSATIDQKGYLSIGELKVFLGVWWQPNNHVDIYVRRRSTDLSVIEISMAHHDGLAQEALDQQNDEAENYPLGPKEYWRSKYMDTEGWTQEEFDDFWNEDDEE